MTEPGVASSDATNISTRIEKTADGKHYKINGPWLGVRQSCAFLASSGPRGLGALSCCRGRKASLCVLLLPVSQPGSSRTEQWPLTADCGPTQTKPPAGHKWWISGSIRPECKVAVLLGKTKFDGPIHSQQSMILVPMDAPGVNILHPMRVFGEEGDHAEIIFKDVMVPVGNMVLGEGRGFEIAQGRLGPGRIHHCMRTIGQAEQALAGLIYRARNRTAFGTVLEKKDTIRRIVAEARIAISSNRQLCYLAACMADEKGFKAARKYIAMIKVSAPRMAIEIIDEAMQVHGGHGISQYSKLSGMWRHMRTLRLADGPDQVHLNTIAKMEFADKDASKNALGRSVSGINHNIEKYGMFDHVTARHKFGGKAVAKITSSL